MPQETPGRDSGKQTTPSAPSTPPAQGSSSPAPSHDSEKKDQHRWHPVRWIVVAGVILVVLVFGLTYGRRWIVDYFTTVSTDDANVNSHVSSLSARVSGQVTAVYVDDNERVEKGHLLLELDHEPYQVAVAQKKAALAMAEANITAAKAQVRGQLAAARAGQFSLRNAQEQVRYQIATLHSDVAKLRLQEANLDLANKELLRVERLVRQQAAPQEELDKRKADYEVAKQQVVDARETIRKTRAALGLPPNDAHPTDVPANLDQQFSTVQAALSTTAQSLSQIGVPIQLNSLTPEVLEKQLDSLKPSSPGAFDAESVIEHAPAVVQAKAASDQAREDLKSAELNLSYTYVRAPIDGQISQRSVNPGNNVTPGQRLMAVRSMTDVWIDANFKENELSNLRIGQRVEVSVDAYPHKIFHGRIEGFSAGTGSSLALIPPENATGNFVKIVQRLPVRITLDPADLSNDTPLFIGLSADPVVKYKEAPTGPHAGERLLPPLPPRSTAQRPSTGASEARQP